MGAYLALTCFRTNILRAIAAVSILCIGRDVHAQSGVEDDAIAIGLHTDYVVGRAGADYPVYIGSPGCGLFTTATGSDIEAGLYLAFPARLVSGGRFVVGPRITGRSLTSTVASGSGYWIFDPAVGEVRLDREYRRRPEWTEVMLDLMVIGRIAGMLELNAGLSPGLRFGFTSDQVEQLSNPAGETSSASEQLMDAAEPLTLRELALRGLLRVALRLPIGDGVAALPSLGIDGDLISPVMEYDLQRVGITAGIGVEFALWSPARPVLPDSLLAPSMPDEGEVPLAPGITVPTSGSSSAAIDLFVAGPSDTRLRGAYVLLEEIVRVDAEEGRTAQIVREKRVHAPMIQIDPRYRADSGVRRWEIELRFDDEPFARYGSDGPLDNAELSWNVVAERIETDSAMLEAFFTVEDSTGAVMRAESEIPVAIGRYQRLSCTMRGESGPTRSVWSIPHIALDNRRALLKRIADSISSHSALYVIAPAELLREEIVESDARRSDEVAVLFNALIRDRPESVAVQRRIPESVARELRFLLAKSEIREMLAKSEAIVIVER